MIDEGIYALLAGDATLQAIHTGRIFQGDAPDDVLQYPCMTYGFVGGAPASETSDRRIAISQRIEINGLSFKESEAKDLANRALLVFLGWQQTLTNGARVISTELVSPGTDFATQQRMFRRMIEFRVVYSIP